LLDRATATYHTTARQAGQIAKAASVKKLLIDIFQHAIKELAPLLHEASYVFRQTELAIEGRKFWVGEE